MCTGHKEGLVHEEKNSRMAFQEQFEQLEVNERVQVFIHQRWQLLRKGMLVELLSGDSFSVLPSIMNLKVLPLKGL